MLLFGQIILQVFQSQMDKNEIVEHIRDEDDESKDNSKIDYDKGSKKRS